MGPFLPNCRFEGFFSLVHASLKIHLFYKALYSFYAFHVSEISEKLSFWVFGTEFSENLGGLGQKSKFLG